MGGYSQYRPSLSMSPPIWLHSGSCESSSSSAFAAAIPLTFGALADIELAGGKSAAFRLVPAAGAGTRAAATAGRDMMTADGTPGGDGASDGWSNCRWPVEAAAIAPTDGGGWPVLLLCAPASRPRDAGGCSGFRGRWGGDASGPAGADEAITVTATPAAGVVRCEAGLANLPVGCGLS